MLTPGALIFLSQCYVSDRELHSFPTRRSSDLEVPEEHRAAAQSELAAKVREAFGVDSEVVGLAPNRSEEHTSELQSHVNLVCRLLLEKKNDGSDDIGFDEVVGIQRLDIEVDRD